MLLKSLDLLVFAPHPDDAEMFCGGTIISAVQKGYKVGVIELTDGEMSTSGTVEERKIEVEASNKILKLSHRQSLGLPDGWLNPYEGYDKKSTDSAVAKIVDCIRNLKPSILLIPYEDDRHPDHRSTSELLTSAVFYSNVGGFKVKSGAARHLVKQVFYYQMRYEFKPSIIVDISDYFELKKTAIHCFKSQIHRDTGKDTNYTLLNSPDMLTMLETRDRYYGGMAGVKYGEPLLMKNIPVTKDIVSEYQNTNEPFFYRTV